MQQGNFRYIVSGVICLLVALYLSGCGGTKGFNLNDARSAFQMVNEQTGSVRDFRTNLQQLMIKLNTLSTITQEGLQGVNVEQVTQGLTNLSQKMTDGMGGLAVDKAVSNVYLRLPIEARVYWNPWLAMAIITLSVNVQASYLNVAVQYMNKNASTMTPDEVKRINAEITTSLGSFANIGV